MDPRGIKVSQIVMLYGHYLSQQGKISIEQMADFILQASRLVFEKALSIAPPPAVHQEIEFDQVVDEPEDDLELALNRYRPYRAAALLLGQRLMNEGGRRSRMDSEGEVRFRCDNIMVLAGLWRRLLERANDFVAEQWAWDDESQGVPVALEDVDQVEVTMERVLEKLGVTGELTLTLLLAHRPSRALFAVTLLALLELTRLGKIVIHQEAMFGDLLIRCSESAMADH